MSDNVKCLLISNSFLKTEKFTEHIQWFKNAANKRGIVLDAKENAEMSALYGFGDENKILKYLGQYSFIIYWDKDIPLGRYLTSLCDKLGIKIYNSVEAIAVCDDKSLTYEKLFEWNLKHNDDTKNLIPLIPTIVAPMTYSGIGYTDFNFVKKAADSLSFPMVVKECFGSFGMQVYLVNSEDELTSLTKRLEGTPLLFQKYIKSSFGRDIRMEVVGDKVVASMYRYSVNGDFRANITNGAKMKAYTPSQTEKDLAVRCVQALGLDFAGVDLLFSGKSETADLVCEVNSNAHFKNIHTCTGINVAEKIFDYIT